MKKKIIRKNKKTRYGKVIFNSKTLERYEERTLFRLADFGFIVETVPPSNIPRSKNPDIVMEGTFWEIKGQISLNEKTITAKFRKAVKQSGGRAIFDLCEARGDTAKTVKHIENLFTSTRGMRRVMIMLMDKDSSEIIIDITK